MIESLILMIVMSIVVVMVLNMYQMERMINEKEKSIWPQDGLYVD